MVLRKKSILLIMVFLIGGFVCACGKEDSVAGESLVEDTEEVSSTEETKNTEEEAAVQWEKGYDLPVDEQEREEAETDCKKLMELYLDIYETADKGIASNVVLDDQTVLEIQKKVKDAGYPIATMVTYSNMENYESVDSFLKECMGDQTVSRRFEPSSRTALIGEQPNPWKVLPLQDAMSRHRGAKPGRRSELLDRISLLSPR